MTSDVDTLHDAVPPWSRAEDAPDLSGLRRRLAEGIAQAGEGGADAGRALGLPEDAEDREVARALVHAIATHEVPDVRIEHDQRFDPREAERELPVAAANASFLGRLGAEEERGGDGSQTTVDGLADPRTLMAVVRAGTLRQRRAALLRLGVLVAEGKGIPGAQVRDAADFIEQLRDVEVAYERHLARARLSGAVGRKARAEDEAWQRLVVDVGREVRAFWDGERAGEPVSELPGDERARLLVRARDLPPLLTAHLAALIEGVDGGSNEADRQGLLAFLRYAGDPRLVPSLRTALEQGDSTTALAAARALSTIDDPRVHAILRTAFERNVKDTERPVLARALGEVGDMRGADYVRSLLDSDARAVKLAALEALETVGTSEDGEHIADMLDDDDPDVEAQVLRTLGRIGTGRMLRAIARRRRESSSPALLGEMEDVVQAIKARLELLGEEAREDATEALALELPGTAALARSDDPALVRLFAWKDYILGHLWLLVGARLRALGRFERAAERRPGWALPLISMAMRSVRKGRYGQALAAFRRAIHADRVRVERNPVVIRALAHAFLRRAEEMERDDRHDIARGLLEEVLTLDLRRAPTTLRLDLERRQEALRRRQSDAG